MSPFGTVVPFWEHEVILKIWDTIYGIFKIDIRNFTVLNYKLIIQKKQFNNYS